MFGSIDGLWRYAAFVTLVAAVTGILLIAIGDSGDREAGVIVDVCAAASGLVTLRFRKNAPRGSAEPP